MSVPTSLYLAPTDPGASPPRDSVVATLAALAIIAEPLDAHAYLAGDGFIRHVIFAGCSPALVMRPPDDGSQRFSHAAVHGPFARARLITGPNSVKPRCPRCRARFDDWRERLIDWRRGAPAQCAGCGNSAAAEALDWRGHAIGARLLVELRNVFPGEASPSDSLMRGLQDATGQPWRYAWAASVDDADARTG